mmetsp:Transcript_9535/g.26789  ORF Transcript_9535/g.26789 Transcript_9535/m.26789 type:complete len:227 (-) Transcript_9535:12-692(-)
MEVDASAHECPDYYSGFMAFTESEAEEIMTSMEINFTDYKDCIFLSDTAADAILTTMKTYGAYVPSIATEDRDWYCLELMIPGTKFKGWYEQGALRRYTGGWSESRFTPAGPGSYFFEPVLSLTEIGFSWAKITVQSLGVEQWAEKTLANSYRRCDESTCDSCGAAGAPCYRASGRHSFSMYCAPCWHAYFDRKVRDDPDCARNVRKFAHARCAEAVHGGSHLDSN